MAHGSRDPRWQKPFVELTENIKASTDSETFIELAYMEFIEPTLMTAAKACYEKGAKHLTILPLFINSHSKSQVKSRITNLWKI